MPTDTQVPGGEEQDAPSDYRVPNTVEFLLKAVHATFTDNGAVTDWLPTVEILSDANRTVGEASDQGVIVTAGDDARVTFAPFLRHAASATPATAGQPWCYLQGASLFSDNATKATWAGFGQDSTNSFSLDVAKQVLTIGTPGLYLHHYYCQWESDAVPVPAAADILAVLPNYTPSASALQEVIVKFTAAEPSHLSYTGAHYFWDPWGLNVVNVKVAGMTTFLLARSRSGGIFEGVPSMSLHRINDAVADVAAPA